MSQNKFPKSSPLKKTSFPQYNVAKSIKKVKFKMILKSCKYILNHVKLNIHL